MKYAVIDIESSGLNRFKDTINFIGVLLPQDKKVFIFDLASSNSARTRFVTLMKKLQDKQYRFVWQNGKFDTLFIDYVFGILLPIHEDTMILGTAYNLSAPHGLKDMAQNYLHVADWDIGKKDKTSNNADTVIPYLKKDLKYTYKIFQYLMIHIKETENKIYRKLLLPAYLMFRACETHGIYLDVDTTKLLLKHYKKERNALSIKLKRLTHKDINWKSPKQVSAYLFDELHLPTYKYTKTGNASTDAETLKRLAKRTKNEVVEILLQYKEYDGAITKFLSRWPSDADNEGYVHPSFGLTNVVTGRTSCQSPNLQQVPRKKELRNLFTAPTGKTLLNFDYSQIELRIAAHYAQDPVMLKIYNESGDIHTTTAQTLTGALKPTKEQRTAAKAVNFGFLYGMGARKFVQQAFNSYGLDVNEAQAQEYRDMYFAQFPRLQLWHEKQGMLCEQDGGVYNLFGRYRELPDIWLDDNYLKGSAIRRAINTPVQSTASDILLSAAIEINAYIQQKNIDAAIVGTIHDSIMIECAIDIKESLKKRVKKIMAHPRLLDIFGVSLTVPLVADVSEGAWGNE